MNTFVERAENLLKQKFANSGLTVIDNESGGVGDFNFIAKTGETHAVFVKVLDLETTERSVRVPKSVWDYVLPDHAWIGLVLFEKNDESWAYLIPANAFENPNQIFINNEQGERLKQFSNWEVKVFSKGTQKLSEYGFANSVKEFK